MANQQHVNTKKPRKPRNGAFRKVTLLELHLSVDDVKYNISVNQCDDTLWTCETKNDEGFVLEKTPLFKQPSYKDLDSYVKRLVELHEKFGGRATTKKNQECGYTNSVNIGSLDDVATKPWMDSDVDGDDDTPQTPIQSPMKLHLPDSEPL